VAPARRERISAFSFVSFSLGLHRQRKAAKECWYLKIVPLILTTSHQLSTFSLTKQTQRKSSQKETLYALKPRGSATLRATAFEKAVQNNLLVCANSVRDKSKFAHQHKLFESKTKRGPYSSPQHF